MHALLKALDDAKHILIIAHLNPDADSMGSALAMYTHVLRLHKKVSLYCVTENMNPALSFLPFFSKVKHYLPKDYDLALSFDCGAMKRLGVELESQLVNIDHHVSNANYGDINLVDTSAISTTQVLYDFFKTNEIKLNAKMATCLYAGLVDDSQNFSTEKTKARTFLMAADLVECGADNALCTKELFKTRSLASIRMKAKILASAKLHCSGKVISNLVHQSFFEETGAYEVDCEEALHETLDLCTVEFAFMLRFTKNTRIKGSLRSKNGLDMNKMALVFGGGGHVHSAGFVCDAQSLEEIEEKIIQEYLKIT
ncbi:bifunctional oligoribonuclease/PAP phosphatase NrnA [Sulfurimonas sp. MAG313]|nr:bifunctional oligoribonuclease/PAP phosphatase NrnA [Sulfurimonas sp. MAG313]MDF1880981.1 bifunctional oligoribonuclease/PAP phosphatase NrnA [Sulfurimonas sp. MAG313]